MGKFTSWKKDEDDFLIRCYDGNANYKELSIELPGRTVIAVRARINKLKQLGKIDYIKDRNSDIPEDMRKCNTCNRIMPLDEFYVVTKKYAVHECKDCCNNRKRLVTAKEREDKAVYNKDRERINAIIEEKKSKSWICPDCKEEKPGTEFYYLKKNGTRMCYCKTCDRKRKAEVELKRLKKRKGDA